MKNSILYFSPDQLKSFWRSERGATAIEYALIAVLICVAIVASLNLFASNMGNMFNTISNTITNA